MDKRYSFDPDKDGSFENFISKILSESLGTGSFGVRPEKIELPTCSIGECFSREEHYYQQRENDTLHIDTNSNSLCINTVEVDFLNNFNNLTKINYEEFKIIMQKIIYEMDINNFWKTI